MLVELITGILFMVIIKFFKNHTKLDFVQFGIFVKYYSCLGQREVKLNTSRKT